MAEQTTPAVAGAETPEAFMADRQSFWLSFTHATVGAVIFVVILLLLMWAFLV
jgi:hypothetical protein